jgi:hypothetical protein
MNTEWRKRAFEAFERATELPMLALSLAIIPLLVVPWVADLPKTLDTTFVALDCSIWAAFALELAVKTYLVERRRDYLVRHWFDVLIVALPFLRPLRVVRSARALRLPAESWDQVTEHLVHVAHAVDPERWDEASPYPGWTYKDLLAHLATGYTVRLAQLRGLLEKGELGAETNADAANAENIAWHRKSSPEALVEEMVRQRSEVRRLLGLLRPEHLEARAAVRRPQGQPPQAGTFLEALQHWHEHDLEHAADLARIMRRPVAPPEV